MNGHKHQSHVDAPEKAFDQAQEKSADRQPFEGRQNSLQKLVHVYAFGRNQPINDAENKTKRRKNSQRPGRDFYV